MKRLLIRSIIILALGLYGLSCIVPLSLATSLDLLEGVKTQVSSYDVGAGDTSTLRVVDAMGNPVANGRAILEVTGGARSNILGELNTQGIIAILNALGFNVGADSKINVTGGLILSTLGISEADFLAGMTTLAQEQGGNPGFILNQGTIEMSQDSFLAMIAGAVENTGTIDATKGAAIVAIGDEIAIHFPGSPLISVSMVQGVDANVFDFDSNQVSDGIKNTGTISANGGVVNLTAQAVESVFDNIINHTGTIEAKSLTSSNGQILLDGGTTDTVQLSGTVDVSAQDAGTTAGQAVVLGKDVNLGLITAGDTTGGTVLVTAQGAINSIADDNTADIVAKDITLTAISGGIGQTNKVDIQGGDTVLKAAVDNGGSMSFDVLGDVKIGALTTRDRDAGTVTVNATGSINSTTDSLENILPGGVPGGAPYLVDDVNKIMYGGVYAKDVNLTANSGGIGNAASLNIRSNGSITANTVADDASVNITTVGDGNIGQINAGVGDITVTSTGNIQDATDDTTSDFIGKNLTLQAQTGIGDQQALEAQTTTITTTTVSGDVEVTQIIIEEDTSEQEQALEEINNEISSVQTQVAQIVEPTFDIVSLESTQDVAIEQDIPDTLEAIDSEGITLSVVETEKSQETTQSTEQNEKEDDQDKKESENEEKEDKKDEKSNEIPVQSREKLEDILLKIPKRALINPK